MQRRLWSEQTQNSVSSSWNYKRRKERQTFPRKKMFLKLLSLLENHCCDIVAWIFIFYSFLTAVWYLLQFMFFIKLLNSVICDFWPIFRIKLKRPVLLQRHGQRRLKVKCEKWEKQTIYNVKAFERYFWVSWSCCT
jgi:hypothetical protein